MLRQRTGTRGMYLNIKANTPLTTKALTIQKMTGALLSINETWGR